MSLDLEKYAELYGKFGDGDIQELLKRASDLSKKRGRPDVVYVEDRAVFGEREEQLVRELEERRALQERLVGFFRREAPVGTERTLYDLAEPYHEEIGAKLQHEEPIANLFIPTRARRSAGLAEKRLIGEADAISHGVKTVYNRMLQALVREGLVHVGDVRNIANLNGELAKPSMTPNTLNFMRVAL